MKTKTRRKVNKKIYRKLTFWLGVAVVGIALGTVIQFTRAWVEPGGSPPSGNIAAPINTSDTPQAKGSANAPRTDKPGSIVAGDFCLPGPGGTCLSSGGGGGGGGMYEACSINFGSSCPSCATGYRMTKCEPRGQVVDGWRNVVVLACATCQALVGQVLVNGQHTASECTGAVVQDGSNSFCQFNQGSCPSGWTKYGGWSETSANTCNGAHVGSCNGRTSCTTSAHGWANAGTETCGYKNESNGQTWNPQYFCTSSSIGTQCNSTDISSCSTFCDEMGCNTWCDPSCSLDLNNDYGCGSYSSYCSTANATCTANMTKVGCY